MGREGGRDARRGQSLGDDSGRGGLSLLGSLLRLGAAQVFRGCVWEPGTGGKFPSPLHDQ